MVVCRPLGESRSLPVWACVIALIAAACQVSSGPSPLGPGRVISVVAAESFWGSIAGQIGGSHVRVQSIVSGPNADPHSFEPTAADARAVAFAQMVIVNGAGYDPWMPHLLAADSGRHTVLNVGRVVKVPDGGNPHRWYNPADVQTVISAITAEYSRLDPEDAGYFRNRRLAFVDTDLHQYDSLVLQIKTRYGGTPVGASESIFSMLAPALGLDLITPYSFLKAISEGTDVSPADRTRIDSQIRHHLIRIYVYNAQNTTPDVQSQLRECKAAGIPTAVITETLTPATATYQAWQSRQLQEILDALGKASLA
ncbi:MAG TPA: zinc ABC transporter substrate-binding protein [Acidimicrobiales bacterium]|nr:zinc ABC transporter substrate-binding protein [Acidimicrobiales bacterium]